MTDALQNPSTDFYEASFMPEEIPEDWNAATVVAIYKTFLSMRLTITD